MPAETAIQAIQALWLASFACQMPLLVPCSFALIMHHASHSSGHCWNAPIQQNTQELLAGKWSSSSNTSSIRPSQHRLWTTPHSSICFPGAPSSSPTRPHPEHCCGPHEHWQGTEAPMIIHAPILSGNTCVRPCPDSMICALLPCAHRLQRLPHNSLGPHPELYVACRSLRMLPCMISTAVSSLQSPQSTRRQRRCALCCSNVTPSGEHPLSLVLSCCSAVLRLRLLAVLWRAILVFSVNSHPLALL